MPFAATIIGLRLTAQSPLASITFGVKIDPRDGVHIDNFNAVGVRVLGHTDSATLHSFPFPDAPPGIQEIFRWQPALLASGQEYRLPTTSFTVPAGIVALSAAPIFRDNDTNEWHSFDDMQVRSQLGFSQSDVDTAVASTVISATASLNNHISTLNSQITSRSAALNALTAQITTLTSQVATLTAERDALQSSLTTLQATNAAQASHITALGAHINGLNTDIFHLNQTITQLQQTATIVGFVPNRRLGRFTIKDFTVFDGIQRRTNGANSGFHEKLDIDFINTQLLSMKQGAQKMRRIAAATDPNFTLTFRTRAARDEEYSARHSASFKEYLTESARILEFAINEVRTNQQFDLDNIRFHRTIIR